MREGPLKKRDRKALEDRIDDISLLRDFYTRSNMEDVRFSSIENMDDIQLADGVTIPDIMVAQRDDGHSDIFNRYQVMEIEPDILDEIEVRGLPKEQSLVLVQDGMKPEEILDAVSTSKMAYPTLEGEQLRLMIQNQVEPELLADMETMGLTVVPMEDGKVQVLGLAKVAEVDAEGKTVLSPKIKEQLEVFEQMGMLELDEELAVEIVEVKPKAKSKAQSKSLAKAEGEEQEEEQDLAKDMQEAKEEQEQEEEELEEEKHQELKIVPLKEKAKAKTQEELEKEELAKKIGCRPEEILCVIRFSSREVASQFFNEKGSMDTSQVLVRLTNNKFWMMEEDREGNFKKSQGLQVSPASMLLADKLKDTKHPGDTWVLPGELKSGKSHEHSERYDFFEVMLPGESKTDGASSVMYVGLDAANTEDMRILASRRNNVYDLQEPHARSTIPGRAFIQGNSGARTEMKMRNVDGQEGLDSRTEALEEQSTTSLADLGRQQELLIRLENIERAIETIEIQTGVRDGNVAAIEDDRKDRGKRKMDGMEKLDEMMDRRDTAKVLPDLYQQRQTILSQLGLNEADLVKVRDSRVQDEDMIRGQKRPH